jgi:hypothetical protein
MPMMLNGGNGFRQRPSRYRNGTECRNHSEFDLRNRPPPKP